MKKLLIIITVIFGLAVCYSQEHPAKFTTENFENQILSYNPNKNQNVSDKDYRYGTMILEETRNAVKNKPENFNLADYFNILNAFLSLKETKENIDLAFRKFVNTTGSCEYILSFENSIKNNSKYDIIRGDYDEQLLQCKSNNTTEKFDISQYCRTYNLNCLLAEKIYSINLNDQKYRSLKLQSKQQTLDEENQTMIDALYKKYETYIGRSLVGKKFENVMWAVIQHSNIDMMERYLPVIKKAVADKEIEVGPLKMLIDRFYGLKYGYQIFGSQGEGFGFKLADEKTKNEIKIMYGIE